MKGRFSKIARRFVRSTRGAILAETIIVVPVVLVFAVGVIEFGAIFQQRLEMQQGVRDAARYWSRCIEENTCSLEIAENIAFYGVPFPQQSTGCDGEARLRVQNWCRSSTSDDPDIIFSPASPREGAVASIPPATEGEPSTIPEVVVYGRLNYVGSPLFNLMNAPYSDTRVTRPTITYLYEQRHIGW